MQIPALTYDALSRPLTAEELRQIRQQTAVKVATAALISVSVLLVVLFLLTVTFHWYGGGTFIVVSGSIVIIGLAMLVWYQRRQATIRYRLQQFAATNNLTYEQNIKDPSYVGFMFQTGYERKLLNRLIVPVPENAPIEIGNHQYVTGSGKSRQTHHIGYARIKLPRRLPHMVLDARSNNPFGWMSNLPAVFNKDQTLSLEGDFDKHFTLYAPRAYERDALYVFTPDVMAAMIDHARGYDIEIIDDEMYLYHALPFRLSDAQVLQGLLNLIGRITPELTQQSDYYADDRVGNRAANVVAMPGQRLRRGVNWTMVVIFIMIAGFQFIDVFTAMNGSPLIIFTLVLGGLIVTTIGTVLIVRSWRSRLHGIAKR